MEKVVHVGTGEKPKRCVPRVVSWNWFFNRRPRGRG